MKQNKPEKEDKTKKKEKPVVTLAENFRRFATGNLGDQYHRNSWKDTLAIIVVVIVGFFLYVIFGN
ncbi:DUF6366 family protein [Tetragenococcus koreensis]|uniref:Uncharacterized protein n=1 Tax=Tetragenococcus koreensis TaxID=290335 RepID=A0AAN4UBY8_9ENTE|nr:DUF6366 family protein [Tetragenococcus koreensis]MCF1584796.1 DUF6366 family protein [Tetragenococcus koreensis]MCF1614557.1 DUF6366 family protein [Tetragenococcus koreensis]MCF1619943.1 DUF6366 family protein [Tetragenococcus koreensis]MCF1624189.1 DUF6366 family protein [Tetragenococcus koreensis]MCF1629119.1 DUF6366 family protein [Tetragenococcus koreensis]